MPSYRDEKTNKWYCKFYYQNHEGKSLQKLKRGFKRKKDAQDYERDFLQSRQFQPNTIFKNFLEIYKNDIYPQLREHSIQTKEYKHNRILPHFGDIPLSEIKPIDVKNGKTKWWLLNLVQTISMIYRKNYQPYLIMLLNTINLVKIQL